MDLSENVIYKARVKRDLTIEACLLLLCARQQMRPDQTHLLGELCSQVDDWGKLIENAREHFIVGLLLKHLKSNCPEKIPAGASKQLKKASQIQAARYLRIAAAQRDLSENILRKHNFPHVFVKGNALANEFYDQPAVRPARDVDVLIPAREIERFWEVAESSGYERLPKPDCSETIPIKHAISFLPAIDLISPKGAHIEVHSCLDKSGKIFDTDEVIARGREYTSDTGAISVPDVHDHFIFICLHHSRHLFSHLHWLADVDAVMECDYFDVDKAIRLADTKNIRATVEACIDLRNASALCPPSILGCKTTGGRDLMEWCVKSIEKGTHVERTTRPGRKSLDFALDWQFDFPHRLGTIAKRVQPTFADYQKLPLPRRWWWIYYLTRPFRLLSEFLRTKVFQSSTP